MTGKARARRNWDWYGGCVGGGLHRGPTKDLGRGVKMCKACSKTVKLKVSLTPQLRRRRRVWRVRRAATLVAALAATAAGIWLEWPAVQSLAEWVQR